MFQVEIRDPASAREIQWFDTYVQAQSFVTDFNQSATNGRMAVFVPFH
jgi:hypothetical protein